MKQSNQLIIPKKVKIHVTRKDIDTGKFGDSNSCAIAKAVKAKLGDHPQVDMYEITVNLRCGVGATYEVPTEAQDFINEFDSIEEDVRLDEGLTGKAAKREIRRRRKALKPFTFEAALTSAEYYA